MFKNSLADSFQNDGFTATIDQVAADARVAYLKRVYAMAFGGLFIAGATGMLSAGFLRENPGLFQGFLPFIIMIGCMLFAQWVCGGMVRSPSTAVLGFVLGNASMGVALGFILLTAMVYGEAIADDKFLLIAQALGLTLLVVLSLTAYVWTNPSEFRWAGAIVSALFIPMLVLMVLQVFWPIGGTFGLLLSGLFVFVSALGLLLSTRDVMHKLSEDQAVQGAFLISMGIIILFWNLLVLLIRLQSRD